MINACSFAAGFNVASDNDDRHFDFAVIFTRRRFGYSGMFDVLLKFPQLFRRMGRDFLYESLLNITVPITVLSTLFNKQTTYQSNLEKVHYYYYLLLLLLFIIIIIIYYCYYSYFY